MVERGEPAARDRPLEPKGHGDGAAAVRIRVRGLAPDAYVPADLVSPACGKTRFSNPLHKTTQNRLRREGSRGRQRAPRREGKRRWASVRRSDQTQQKSGQGDASGPMSKNPPERLGRLYHERTEHFRFSGRQKRERLR